MNDRVSRRWGHRFDSGEKSAAKTCVDTFRLWDISLVRKTRFLLRNYCTKSVAVCYFGSVSRVYYDDIGVPASTESCKVSGDMPLWML
jgi:hypothetical protein